MSTEDRIKIRLLQDAIIALCESQGIADDTPVSRDMPSTITVSALRQYIYPEYEQELRNVLAFISPIVASRLAKSKLTTHLAPPADTRKIRKGSK